MLGFNCPSFSVSGLITLVQHSWISGLPRPLLTVPFELPSRPGGCLPGTIHGSSLSPSSDWLAERSDI